jgi:hypothetical protein
MLVLLQAPALVLVLVLVLVLTSRVPGTGTGVSQQGSLAPTGHVDDGARGVAGLV